MTIWCKHAHRLELQQFFFVLRSLARYGKFATTKWKKTYAILVYGHVHIIAVLKSENKILLFLVILAWLCHFKS